MHAQYDLFKQWTMGKRPVLEAMLERRYILRRHLSLWPPHRSRHSASLSTRGLPSVSSVNPVRFSARF